MKFVFISGGVLSGLGKGTITSSLALLLKSRGYKVSPVKIDMYINIDAGTIRPQEHGEVFVTHDGLETDEDMGHYERFLNQNLNRESYITTGQIYQEVIRKERAFEYEGEDVEAIPHVTDEIERRIRLAGKYSKSDIVIVELGGTVGEYQNSLFFEASRIMGLRNPGDVTHIHVTYLPFVPHIGELKSKPAQTSVHILNGMGIHPDIMVARTENPIDKRRLDRLALFCSIRPQDIFSSPNLESAYKVPLNLLNGGQGIDERVIEKLNLKLRPHKMLSSWKKLNESITVKKSKSVSIAIVGKYFATGNYKLSDSYVCVIEALKHASWKQGIDIKLVYINSDDVENKSQSLENFDGIIVPQGWGSRGTEGKILAAKYARENNIPYLGLCFGMQMATIEFARNMLKLNGANSQEVDAKTKFPVIHIMENQKEYLDKKMYGGTIRLGAWPCKIKKGTVLEKLYRKYGGNLKNPWYISHPKVDTKQEPKLGELIFERHRHRYEFNNKYKSEFEKMGMTISGTSPDGQLVEAIEIKDHPFFVGVQYHPEYISRPLTPHPIFMGFIESMKSRI